MNALVMCGGSGTRLEVDTEKPLYEVCGTPMVDAVLTALETAAPVDAVHAAVSPATPATAAHLRNQDRPPTVIETAGEGYVEDLDAALPRVGVPAVTAAADLPLLAADHVAAAVADHATHDLASVTICVPAALKRLLGLTADVTTGSDGHELAPTGLNVVGSIAEEVTVTRYDARLAVNVNRVADATVAEALCD